MKSLNLQFLALVTNTLLHVSGSQPHPYGSFELDILKIAVTAPIVFQVSYTEPIKSTYKPEDDQSTIRNMFVVGTATIIIVRELFSCQNRIHNMSIMLDMIYKCAFISQLLAVTRYRLVENQTGKWVLLMSFLSLFLNALNWNMDFINLSLSLSANLLLTIIVHTCDLIWGTEVGATLPT